MGLVGSGDVYKRQVYTLEWPDQNLEMTLERVEGGWIQRVVGEESEPLFVGEDILDQAQITVLSESETGFSSVVGLDDPDGLRVTYAVEATSRADGSVVARVVRGDGTDLGRVVVGSASSSAQPMSAATVIVITILIGIIACSIANIVTECGGPCRNACAPDCVDSYKELWCGRCECHCHPCGS